MCKCCLHAEESIRLHHDTLHNGSMLRQTGYRGEELLNKVVIFVFFVHKKYYCTFVKLQMNH